MASVRRLLLAVNYDKESEALRYLLGPVELKGERGLNLRLLNFESPVLSCEGDDEGRNISQSLLEDLLLYMVIRKFGATTNSAGGKAILGVDQLVLVSWERPNEEQPTEIDNLVESLYGQLLKSEWDSIDISTLNRVAKRLRDPRARQRFLTFAFQIIRQSSRSMRSLPVSKASDLDVKFFNEAVRLLLLGVTDLWSAIRKDAAKSAADIVFEFTSQSHIEQFMDNLLCVAIGSRSVSADKSQVTAWTEREGALLALSVLVRSVKMESVDLRPTTAEEHKASQVKDDIKGILGIRQLPVVKYRLGPNAQHTLTQLPRCLVRTLKPAMYQCIRHDQLSVRQLAAQCLVEFALLCEEPTRLLIFQEVISKLNRINRNEANENESAENSNELELLDAFEAEGLLDVLARMTPCLPSSFLLKHWKLVFPTLEKYVMHIASSVRQMSSSVVLALAKESLSCVNQIRSPGSDDVEAIATSSNETSLELMVQMLCSLSKQRNGESSFCWQQKEGRLLSIDVLIKVLGESLLSCGTSSCQLLRLNSISKARQQSGLLPDLQSLRWAHNQTQASTWVLDRDDEKHHVASNETEQNKVGKESLAHAISIWIEKNNGRNCIPASKNDFWQHVLSGCITQTKEAFESSQFELRRISRQVLPGLMRLTIWTEQLKFLTSAELKNVTKDMSWGWTCMKYILLHMRYLEENILALDENHKLLPSQGLAANWKTVWGGIMSLINCSAQSLTAEKDAVVIQVEVKVMAFLCYGPTDSSRQASRLLGEALQSIQSYLPEPWQLGKNTVTSDNSLDRQFCMFLVPVLPAVVTTLHRCFESVDGSTNASVDTCESDRSSNFQWFCLERIALAWLLCDDMFRWITISKSEAQSQILESLRILLHFPNNGFSCIEEEREEVNKIIRCLHDIFAVSKNVRMKDSIYAMLVDIYLQLWLRGLQDGSVYTDKVVIAITQLYSEQQCILSLPNMKPVETTHSWDDDEDEVQQSSPVGDDEDVHSSPVTDFIFQKALEFLGSSQVAMLYQAVSSNADLAKGLNIPTKHIARMQQQIEACYTPNLPLTRNT